MTKDTNQDKKDKLAKARLATKQVQKLTKELIGDSEWTILQIIAQEIIATYICQDKARPTIEKLQQHLKEEVALRYKDDERVRDILLEGIPTVYAISLWLKKAGWDDAVWSHIKQEGLFTSHRRASLINALYERGKDKSDTAAKLWLTMSGDYSEKVDMHSDNTIDQFREIQQAIFKKKSDN